MYPSVIEALFGNETREPLVLSNSVEVQIFLKKAHRIYWDEHANDAGNLWGVARQDCWHYDFLSPYVDYFTNLRIGELINTSLPEFLNMDFYQATQIVNRAVERAKRELEEEKRRKEAEEAAKRNRKPFKERIKKR